MHLKSLNIVGFKTFALETDLQFDPGFTAVVGPNGSGKSNIVDSVKWVFGEKSAKGLRGEKMDDVIFHGTENRRPAGFAEVSILFDNADRYFSIDFPSVKITRRLYPDGENEYYLNDVRSARKDIEKTLLDTGIGKSSYSILEQGRVDQILNSKPEERRAIFEEAAGVSRFKFERKEALKKLEDTKQNLLRIQDILNSMQKELDLKEKQSEKAEAYFKIKSELDESDKNIRFLKLVDYKTRMQASDSELKEIREKNESLFASIQTETNLISQKESEKERKEKEVADIDKKLFDHLSQTQIQKEKIGKNKSFIEDYENRIQELRLSLEEDQNKISRLELEKQNQIQEIQELDENKARIEVEIAKNANAQEGLLFSLKEEELSIQTKEERISENEKRHLELRDEQKRVILELISDLEEKKKESILSSTKRESDKEELFIWWDSVENSLVSTLSQLEGGDVQGAYQTLQHLQIKDQRERFRQFIENEDRFRSMLFAKDGILSKKESVDQAIEDLLLENENLTRGIRNSQNLMSAYRHSLEENRSSTVDLEKKSLETQAKKDVLLQKVESLLARMAEATSRIQSAEEQNATLVAKKQELELEVVELERQIESSYQEFLAMSKILESQKSVLQGLLEEIQTLKSNITKNQEVFQTLLPLLSEKERISSGLKVQIEAIVEDLYNDYSLTDTELEREKAEISFDQKDEERKLRSLKSEIQMMGSINPLAIEEFKNIKDVFEHNLAQKNDIEESKKDIEEVLAKINDESEKLFQETFERIKENFQETFSTLFNGGRATLELTDKEDQLNAGVEIMAEPPGKHVQNLRLLSGGEKSLTAIALLFAIYMVKPSPFCFLDEIDAALDEANKLRFCQILDRFKDKTQFIVVSHAQSTISRANAIFGVTNEEPGVSKLISLRLDEAKEFSKKSQFVEKSDSAEENSDEAAVAV